MAFRRQMKKIFYEKGHVLIEYPYFVDHTEHTEHTDWGTFIENDDNQPTPEIVVCECKYVLFCVCICKQFVLDYRKVFGKAVAKENIFTHCDDKDKGEREIERQSEREIE